MTRSVRIDDQITPALKRMVRRTKDLSPVMRRVETEIIMPMAVKAFAASGIHSRSGELQRAIQTWHGKKSAGVSVKDHGKTLATPKAAVLSEGRKKASYKTKKRPVRAHRRNGRKVRRHARKSIAPWGDIPARPFIPTTHNVKGSDLDRMGSWIKAYMLAEKKK
jgi:hypothetical protein